MGLESKTKKIILGEKRKEVTIVVEPSTKEEARKMYPYRPYNKDSESRFGNGNTMSDDFALLLSGVSKRCIMCNAPTRLEYLTDNSCPDCDGSSEYHGTDPRKPVNK